MNATPPLTAMHRALEPLGLRALDLAFADFLAEREPGMPPRLYGLAALVSHQLGEGHLCLDLRRLPDLAAAQAWPAALRDLLGAAGDHDATSLPPSRLLACASGEPAQAPLVLDGPRLYLRRCWVNECAVARGVLARAAHSTMPAAPVRAELDRLFPAATTTPAGEPDWQRVACALATRSDFAVITGGPGTGKTTTVVRVLALLQTLHLRDHAEPLRIGLAAPTGKAAARLGTSITSQVARLDVADPVRAAIPTRVATLHRLLGARPDTRRFRHDHTNPLPLDVLVVDEASMVDLDLMAAVLDALPATTRLILLGDKDQLSSVEAGAVLGDLCHGAGDNRYDAETVTWLQAATGTVLPAAATPRIQQCIAALRVSHRFAADSGIGQLAQAVNGNQPDAAQALLAGHRADLSWLPAADLAALATDIIEGAPSPDGTRQPALRDGIDWLRANRPAPDAAPAALADWAQGALAAFNRFQLLCGLRRGPFGVEGINPLLADALRERGLIEPGENWYEGRPVMLTRNDYRTGLMNGDVGLCLRIPAPERPGGQRLVVAFTRDDGGVRFLSPSRLTEVETAYALTVHKAQGSEFDHAMLLLPPAMSDVLTSELLYTAITRARHHVTLAGSAAVITHAIQARTQRHSGLADRVHAR